MQTIAAHSVTPTAAASPRMLWWFAALSLALHVLVLAQWRTDAPHLTAAAPTLDVLLLGEQSSTPASDDAAATVTSKSDRPSTGSTANPRATATDSENPSRPVELTTRDGRKHNPSQERDGTRDNSRKSPTSQTAAPALKTDTRLPAPVAQSSRGAVRPSPVASRTIAISRDQLMQRIQRRLALLRDYPPVARRRGWEGDVHLTFRVTEHGAINAVRVALSSGFKLLDDNAVEALNEIRDLIAGGETIDQPQDLSLAVRYRLIDG